MKRAPLSSSHDAASIAPRSEMADPDSVAVIIMAAGLGKRMQSKVVKVLHPVAGRPMVLYAVDLGRRFGDQGVAVVVGHQGDQVRALLEAQAKGTPGRPSLHMVVQEQQLGTGHAVRQTRPVFASAEGGRPSTFLILNGDTPLLTEDTVEELLRVHRQDGATVTLLTALLDDPTGYGRVVRALFERGETHVRNQAVLRIVEDRDATPAEAALREINVGTYVVDGAFLFEALEQIRPQNAQGEYYLTDIVGLAVAQDRPVAAVPLRQAAEGLGVNTRAQLAEAERTVRDRIRATWLAAGVTMKDPATTWIDADVKLGRDTVLYPHVTLYPGVVLGDRVAVHSGTRIGSDGFGYVFREGAHQKLPHVGGCVIGVRAQFGPGLVLIHPIGVVINSSVRGGRNVWIESGVVIGENRGQVPVLGDDLFVGSGAKIIGGVRIGQGARIGANAVVLHDVPDGATAVGIPARARPAAAGPAP